jgi:hypothetical protein
MVEVEPEPVDRSGTLHLSDELAALLKPHMKDRDNIAVRFMGKNLPTTATAIITELYIPLSTSISSVRWYAIRAMVFETPSTKIGLNAYFQPVRTEFVEMPVGQVIQNGPIYNFRETYNTHDAVSEDFGRLLQMSEAAYSETRHPEPAIRQEKPSWWRKFIS